MRGVETQGEGDRSSMAARYEPPNLPLVVIARIAGTLESACVSCKLAACCQSSGLLALLPFSATGSRRL